MYSTCLPNHVALTLFSHANDRPLEAWERDDAPVPADQTFRFSWATLYKASTSDEKNTCPYFEHASEHSMG